MTKHVDSKLLGEHVQSMGCEFIAGRAELAPQVVQEIGDEVEVSDVVDYIEDALGGLMTTSVSEQPATLENHCAMESEVCLSPGRLFGHRVVDEDCEGGNEARERVLNRLRGCNHVDRDCEKRMSRDEHLRGHPFFFFYFAVWAVSFEGRCLF